MNQPIPQNITDHIYRFAKANPDKAAFLHPVQLNFGDLIHEVDRYAEGFRKQGIRNGARAVVLISPSVDLFAVTFALFRIGAIPVMIDPGMGRRRMVDALSSVNASAFIGIRRSHLLRYLHPGAFQTVQTWISTGYCWFGRASSLKRMAYINTHTESFIVQPDDDAALFFTSGSTGPPKGVIYKNRMLEAQIEFLKKSFGYGPDEIDLCTFPLIGILLICMGISIVLADMDMMHPAKLKPGRVIKNIRDYQCTHVFCSPMVLKRLSDYGIENNIKIESLKLVMTAGAPVHPSVLRNFRELLLDDARIHTPYGATEALPVTDIRDDELLELYNESDGFVGGVCVGYALEGIDIKIISILDTPVSSFTEANVLKTNEVGEIVIAGPNVTESYWMNKYATEMAKIEEQGILKKWHRTGDLGRVDPEGRLWFYGRKSQRVVTNDNTYFTIPVEAIFNQHPEVSRAALVGVENPDVGEKLPVICIELKKNGKRAIYLQEELRSMALNYVLTRDVKYFLFHRRFPVDPRHNAKIYREKLSVWASNRLNL